MKFDGFESRMIDSIDRSHTRTDDSATLQRPPQYKPSAYRSDPFPESAKRDELESFHAGVEAILGNTKPKQRLTLQEAQGRLAELVSQITAINQSIERDRQTLLHNGQKIVPEHILNRRKKASRARNILQQEATQVRSLIVTMSESAAREEKASLARSRTESTWRAYLGAEEVLNAIENAGGTVGALGEKYRKRSRSEVPPWFREEWTKTHRNGVFIQPDSEPAVPLVSVPATMADRLAAVVGTTGTQEQKLVKYQSKKRPVLSGGQ